MNTKNLDTFIAVSKYASINAAAEALFISPPALQQQLNRRENEIGFRLLDRNPGGIRLTPPERLFWRNRKNALRHGAAFDPLRENRFHELLHPHRRDLGPAADLFPRVSGLFTRNIPA